MLDTNQRAVLAHIVLDPDAWYANAVASLGQSAADAATAAKVAKYSAAYAAAVAAGSYMNRAQRDAATADAAAPTLDEMRDAAKKSVDLQAEACRLLFITDGAGQAMTYQRKLEEARAYSEVGDAPAGTYPLLEASVGIEGVSVAAIATLVVATSDAWGKLAAEIERERLGAKHDIDAASSIDAVNKILVALDWPSP